MITILPIGAHVERRLTRWQLRKKFAKQCILFIHNPKHPSLHVELMEPHNLGIYSFRIDRKYRAVFIFRETDYAIEILTVTLHYQ
ncbi:hypothetical protein A2363_00315 [Candidatus Gottesmanbacteria bacterium RIFOXYB1_FULL_47_11]|uniref:Toxin YoeB n=1 Tax=Candidatus Gottesmanbacteria bacterium RIFOXYB1_FULL_47_11 TaxID=1798401 RepID=A0A1F6BD43_9BACT|nr:MAG: hypothetical protein A2363_00315 [Candidatus Gottesmanbacteria bacterium RIFOXYB1_FULL_47_11]